MGIETKKISVDLRLITTAGCSDSITARLSGGDAVEATEFQYFRDEKAGDATRIFGHAEVLRWVRAFIDRAGVVDGRGSTPLGMTGPEEWIIHVLRRTPLRLPEGGDAGCMAAHAELDFLVPMEDGVRGSGLPTGARFVDRD